MLATEKSSSLRFGTISHLPQSTTLLLCLSGKIMQNLRYSVCCRIISTPFVCLFKWRDSKRESFELRTAKDESAKANIRCLRTAQLSSKKKTLILFFSLSPLCSRNQLSYLPPSICQLPCLQVRSNNLNVPSCHRTGSLYIGRIYKK